MPKKQQKMASNQKNGNVLKRLLVVRSSQGPTKIGQYQSSILISCILATLIDNPFQMNLVYLKLQDAICTTYEQNYSILSGWVIRTMC